ncbi:MAG: hypothetical protein K9G11_04285 [Rickettsiaceae bacterium]|nr:hypothetical protein [Rickettsiaceae bacterium]
MGRLVTILSSIILLSLTLPANSSTIDKNALQSRLLDANEYVNTLVDRVKVLVRDNNGKDLASSKSQIVNTTASPHPYFKELTISKKYEILMQFASKKAYQGDYSDEQFDSRRIMLVPIFAIDADTGKRSWIPTTWSCITDLQGFNDDLVQLNKYLGVKSPTSAVKTNKYLSGCQSLSPSQLDVYWNANQ